MGNQKKIKQSASYNEFLENADALKILDFFSKEYPGRVAFSSSMGAEDQVITHLISESKCSINIFTLDTGRLFPETYDLIEKTNSRYHLNIEVYYPNNEMVEKMVNEHGINLFYRSVENRKRCCHIRKIEPLQRALNGMDIWITGLRNEQSVTRKNNQTVEWDNSNNIIKVNPLIHWNEKMVWDFIKQHNIPYNLLHDKGFPSIGCQPCTRAIQPGEDVRAGRWWWENPEMKECGLHNNLNQET